MKFLDQLLLDFIISLQKKMKKGVTSQIELMLLWKAIELSLNEPLQQRIKDKHKELMESYDSERGT